MGESESAIPKWKRMVLLQATPPGDRFADSESENESPSKDDGPLLSHSKDDGPLLPPPDRPSNDVLESELPPSKDSLLPSDRLQSELPPSKDSLLPSSEVLEDGQKEQVAGGQKDKTVAETVTHGVKQTTDDDDTGRTEE